MNTNITKAFEGSLYCRASGQRIGVVADSIDELKAKLNGYIANYGKLWATADTVPAETIAAAQDDVEAAGIERLVANGVDRSTAESIVSRWKNAPSEGPHEHVLPKRDDGALVAGTAHIKSAKEIAAIPCPPCPIAAPDTEPTIFEKARAAKRYDDAPTEIVDAIEEFVWSIARNAKATDEDAIANDCFDVRKNRMRLLFALEAFEPETETKHTIASKLGELMGAFRSFSAKLGGHH